MCKIGDILLIYNAKNGQYVGKHPFIVLDDNAGKVRGVYSYDFIGLLVSSANTEEKKERLRSFEGTSLYLLMIRLWTMLTKLTG